MEPRSHLFILGLGVVYLAARAPAQLFEDPTKTYKNMTFAFDVRHRGGLQVPHCVKLLMDCWEVMKGDIICSHRQYYETACSFINNKRCHDLVPFGDAGWPYTSFQMFEEFCRGTSYWT